jgi:hypothetical protein
MNNTVTKKQNCSFSKPSKAAASNSVTLTHTLESPNNSIALYDAWNKPEKAEQWRAKLLQMEAVKE